MASLGSFRAAAREYDPDSAETTTFDFYDESFTVHAEIPSIVELTLTAAVAGKVPAFEGDVALYDALRCALTIPEHERDGTKIPADTSQWRRFSKLAAENNAPDELLSEICFSIMGWQIGRPTEQRSTSSPGLLPTSTNWNSSASDTPA